MHSSNCVRISELPSSRIRNNRCPDGFSPSSTGIASFKKELSGFEVSKGTVKLPLDKRLPLGPVRKIVKFRVKEILEKIEAKGKKK
jgi:uncharacterized protein YdhG (YjbR/CyaY superfamily)